MARADTADVARIMEMIPHRYPFLLVDRVVDIVPDVSAVGIKNITINEPQFQGHFPQHAVMPGVLIVEAMASDMNVLIEEVDEMKEIIASLAWVPSEFSTIWDRIYLAEEAIQSKAWGETFYQDNE